MFFNVFMKQEYIIKHRAWNIGTHREYTVNTYRENTSWNTIENTGNTDKTLGKQKKKRGYIENTRNTVENIGNTGQT